VTEFENKVAEFFGGPYAVAVDSCTHGLELCLRYLKADSIRVPQRTYLSVAMLANKLNIRLDWVNWDWNYMYNVGNEIIDAATAWGKNEYMPGYFMCLSFQYQKHLSLGRGGMILCPDEQSAATLRKMSYDGRERGIAWRGQDIDTMGYHYYMTPETAALGLQKLPEAISTPAKVWDSSMYPDLTQMKIFKTT
jgi:dTDP-4-amino-4,6-dideoxygalactose transaminase